MLRSRPPVLLVTGAPELFRLGSPPLVGQATLHAAQPVRRRAAVAAIARRGWRHLRAASRLRSWERSSWAVTVSTPPTNLPESRSSARDRCTGPSAVVPATSRLSSTRESAVFTDWPPGPDERLNRHRSSRSGIRIERVTRSGPSMTSVSRPLKAIARPCRHTYGWFDPDGPARALRSHRSS
jgi:hypothetical protein